jgi:hypothetical protein
MGRETVSGVPGLPETNEENQDDRLRRVKIVPFPLTAKAQASALRANSWSTFRSSRSLGLAICIGSDTILRRLAAEKEDAD